MLIYYDSATGNVARFINQIIQYRPLWTIEKISESTVVKNKGHLVTFTTKIGEVPTSTEQFLLYQENYKHICSVSSSGNRNWGPYYAVAADLISKRFSIPVTLKFELSGTRSEVNKYIECLENNL